jgi:hypothetical protein
MAIGMLYIRRLRDAAMTLSTARPGLKLVALHGKFLSW